MTAESPKPVIPAGLTTKSSPGEFGGHSPGGPGSFLYPLDSGIPIVSNIHQRPSGEIVDVEAYAHRWAPEPRSPRRPAASA